MREDELTALLRSPQLSLDPPSDLAASVHRGARHVRRRRAAGTAVLSALALASAALVLPELRGAREVRSDPFAAASAARFPQATTSVQLLEQLNGGEVVTFYAGTRWCTGAARTLVNDGCRGFVGTGPVAPFALYLLPGDPSLTVDADSVTAGVLGTGVTRMEVAFDDGTTVPASAVSGDGFPRPVWWAAVPDGRTVTAVRALDAGDQVLDELTLRLDASYAPSPSPRSASE